MVPPLPPPRIYQIMDGRESIGGALRGGKVASHALITCTNSASWCAGAMTARPNGRPL